LSFKTLITICARGGSKGIPNKNLIKINGKPLIGYTIDFVKKIKNSLNCKIALSSDNDKIIQYSKSLGINTKYKRPDYLATDQSSKIDTISHLLLYEEKEFKTKYDYILDLDVSSPLRKIEDILNSYNYFLEQKEMMSLFSVNDAQRNPYFNMVEEDEKSGYYKLIKNIGSVIKSRQKAPKVFDMNASFYWYRRDFFNKKYSSPITDKSGIYKMEHICFDIDNHLDLKLMEYLISSKEIDFLL